MKLQNYLNNIKKDKGVLFVANQTLLPLGMVKQLLQYGIIKSCLNQDIAVFIIKLNKKDIYFNYFKQNGNKIKGNNDDNYYQCFYFTVTLKGNKNKRYRTTRIKIYKK